MALGWPRPNDSLSVDMVRIRSAWMRETLTRDNNFIFLGVERSANFNAPRPTTVAA